VDTLRNSWVEFFDPSDPGPFGDSWHTKEGVSKGNAGGPWDGASGPMNGCMRGLKAKSSLDMLWCVCPPAFEGIKLLPALAGKCSLSSDLTVAAAQGWLMVCTPVHADTVG
jgi:hypothetical protein